MRGKQNIGAAAAVAMLAACGGNAERAANPPAAEQPAAIQAFAALPAAMESDANPITPAKVDLGRMLYYDTRLSASGDVSCYVCHPLHDYGTSHRSTGVGHDALKGGRNEPTVYNAAGHVAQFWDGRAADVEAQALGPVVNPIEMGMADGDAVVAVLNGIPGYVEAFRRAFPNDADPLTFENFGLAIAAFERGLVTPSRWDAYVSGDAAALSVGEVAGFTTFFEAGCATCHSGTYVGGSAYRKVGLVRPWFQTRDPGRVAITGDPADEMVFKVPSLRNVDQTWPYFHDGSVQRLEDAVRLMAIHQTGQNLSDEQIRSIVTWLRTLTGPIPTAYIDEPALPAAPSAQPGLN